MHNGRENFVLFTVLWQSVLSGREAGKSLWATPCHTTGGLSDKDQPVWRSSEQGLSVTGLQKVGVLSYLACCLLFRKYFHQLNKNCISKASMYLL